MPKVIVYGFKKWDPALGRSVESRGKAEVATIEALGCEPIGSDSQAVEETDLNADRIYLPPAEDEASGIL